MDWQAWFVIAVTASALLTLVTTRLGPDLVMMGALTLISVFGILSPGQALSGFSNSGLITVAAMFIIAAGIRSSGGVDLLVEHLLGRPKGLRRAQLRITLPVVMLSGFLNNTPVVATLIPAVTSWARRLSLPVSTLMMPLSYAAIMGGTITLIGTSTNLVTNGQYQALTGAEGFSLFAITPVGLAVSVVGIMYMLLVLPRLLSNRQAPHASFEKFREYTVEMAVSSSGPLVGKTVEEAGLRNLKRVYLVEIERDGNIVTAVSSEERLRGGDRLVFAGDIEAVIDLQRINGLIPSESGDEPALARAAPERRLVEAVVSNDCDVVGQTIRDCRFRDRYGAAVLAVARNGRRVPGNLGSIRLQPADTLLLEARPAFVTRQRYTRDFLLINDIDEERPRHDKAILSWLILLGLVLLAATGITSMLNAALLGCGAMLATRCISVSNARRSLDVQVIVTIAASFAVGNALYETGAAQHLGESVLSLANDNPLMLLILTYFMVSILTEIITNNAAAVLMLPVVLAMTQAAGLPAEPFVITVMMAASAAFSTPLGYQTNLMVYGPGGYRFSDFLKAGIPLNILAGITTVTVVPMIWPLT